MSDDKKPLQRTLELARTLSDYDLPYPPAPSWLAREFDSLSVRATKKMAGDDYTPVDIHRDARLELAREILRERETDPDRLKAIVGIRTFKDLMGPEASLLKYLLLMGPDVRAEMAQRLQELEAEYKKEQK